jgi:hypothetical protein
MPADAAPDILAGGALVAGDIGLLLVLVAGVVVIDDAAGVVDIAGLASPLGAAGMLGVPAQSGPAQAIVAVTHAVLVWRRVVGGIDPPLISPYRF